MCRVFCIIKQVSGARGIYDKASASIFSIDGEFSFKQ